MMTDPELLAEASQITLSDDRQRSHQEREASAFIDRLRAATAERERVEAYVAGRVRELESERERLAEEARRDAEDPITTLAVALEPSADTDIVMLAPLGIWPDGSPEFRIDGQRHRYGQHGLQVACAPAAHFPDQSSRFPAALFDDLIGMYEAAAAKDAAAESPNFYDPSRPRPRDAASPLEMACAIVANSTDRRMFPTLARWYRFAESSELPGRFTLADRIRTHLTRLDGRHLIVDEYAEIMRSTNGLGVTHMVHR